MIPWKFVILAVLLVHVHLAAAFNHRIDPARCKTDAKDATCFVRDSCIKNADNSSGKTGVLTQFNDQTLINDTCDVFMMIKSFSINQNKWHVMMQVNATGEENLVPTKGIRFVQKTEQFSCEPSMKDLKGELSPAKFDDGSTFSAKSMFCTITITSTSGTISSKFARNDNKPTFTYDIGNQEEKIEYENVNHYFWILPQAYCNIEYVKSKDDISGNFLLQEVDTTLSEFNCSDARFSLKVLPNGGEMKTVDRVFCDSGFYTYLDGQNKIKIDKADISDPSFDIFCAAEFCSLCSEFSPMKCTNCVPLEFATTGNCKTAKCPGDTKWRLPEGILSEEAPVCKKDGTTASWYRGDTKITEGACSAKSDCLVYSNLTLTCQTEGCIEAKLTDDNQTVYCPDGYNVTFGMEPIVVNGNLTCAVDSGLYKPEEGQAPPQAAHVGCQKRSDPSASAAPSTGFSAGKTAGIVIGVLFLVVVIAILIFLLIKRRRSIAADKASQVITKPPDSDDTADMKTAIGTNSKEGFMAAAASKSASGSEAPPSTDRPSKEKIGSEGPPSTERPSKEKMPADEKEKKDDKSGDKKDEKKESKKEEKKEGGGSKREKKKEEKKEEKKPKKEPAKIMMDMTRKSVPNLKEINRQLEQMKGNEPADYKPGKRVDLSDITPAQWKVSKKPGKKIEYWNEEIFQEDLLPIIALLTPDDRCNFLRNLTVFEQHSPKGTEGVCGSLTQFFQVVRRCEKKQLDCLPSWEIIIRLVKLLCANLPQKEAADIIDRMRKMMRGIGHMMLKGIGYFSDHRDTDDHKTRRELALRILLAAEDPVALEELGKHAEAKPDDVDPSIQTVVFSYALNRMGKKAELEERLYEELKKSAKEHPKPTNRPFGTMRQHLIYALCSDNNVEGMSPVLEMVLEPKSRRDQSTPEGEFNPTDVLCAYRGATEHAGHVKKVLAIFKAKKFAPSNADLTGAVVDEYAKSPEEKRELTKQMSADIAEILCILAESCVTNEQYLLLHSQVGEDFNFSRKESGRDAFDPKKFDDRTKNLETILKNKKCIEMIDEAMKKAEY